MAKPRKSTLDAFIDQFCEMDLNAQYRALDLMTFEHRRACIRFRRENPKVDLKFISSAESKAAPAAHCIDKGLSDSPAPGAVQPIQTLFDGAAPKPAKSIP